MLIKIHSGFKRTRKQAHLISEFAGWEPNSDTEVTINYDFIIGSYDNGIERLKMIVSLMESGCVISIDRTKINEMIEMIGSLKKTLENIRGGMSDLQ